MTKRMMCRILAAVAVLGLTVGLAGKASAGTILYTYTTTLSLASGTNSSGLNGAKAEIDVSVDTNTVYVSRFGFPAAIANSGATITISGDSIAINNGTFALPQLAFYATFAGMFTEPGGVDPSLTLPSGNLLFASTFTNPTAHGSVASVGDTVNLLDFVPATTNSTNWTVDGTSTYSQSNTTITAALADPSDVPEIDPGSALSAIALLGCGASILSGRRRRKPTVA